MKNDLCGKIPSNEKIVCAPGEINKTEITLSHMEVRYVSEQIKQWGHGWIYRNKAWQKITFIPDKKIV